MYGFLADLMVGIHVAYVAFVVIGQILILIGWALGWRWVRNRWFRIIHLVAIGFVAFEELIDMHCPFTIWERQFRDLAGQPFSGETFLSRLFHALIFYEWPPIVFTLIHLGFAAVVVLTFVLCPPRFRPSARPAGADASRDHF